jgi:hypothetical protein
MATFYKGPLGGFSGSIGPVVGSSWKDLDVMHSQPGPRKGDPTQAQLDQQAKFALAGSFVKQHKRLLAFTMPDSNTMTGYNIALQQVLYKAITGTSNAYALDYPKVELSRGDLPNAFGFSVASGAAGKVTWSWQASGGANGEAPTDVAILVAYCEELGRSAFTLSGPARSTGAGTLTIPVFSGKVVQTWMAFVSADGAEIANSAFTGQLTVQ